MEIYSAFLRRTCSIPILCCRRNLACTAACSSKFWIPKNSAAGFTANSAKQFLRIMTKKYGLSMKLYDHGGLTTGNMRVKVSKQKHHIRSNASRAEHLSIVLERAIADILSSGEFSEQLGAVDVELTKVFVLPNFTHIEVHWRGKGSKEEDAKTEALLDGLKFQLQNVLAQSGTFGSLPPIRFVCDMGNARLAQLDDCFRRADYGFGYDTPYLRSLRDTNRSKSINDKNEAIANTSQVKRELGSYNTGPENDTEAISAADSFQPSEVVESESEDAKPWYVVRQQQKTKSLPDESKLNSELLRNGSA